MLEIPIVLIVLIILLLLCEFVTVVLVFRITRNYLTTGAAACIIGLGYFLVVSGIDNSTTLGRFVSSPAAEKFANRYIKESSVLTSVFRDYPKERDRFVSKVVTAYRSGGAELASTTFAKAERSIAETYIREILVKSQASAIVYYASEILAVAKNLARSSPVLCYAFLYQESEKPTDLDLHLSGRDLFRLSNATRQIFMLYSANRHLTVDTKGRHKALRRVLRRVRKRMGAGNFVLPDKNLGSRDKSFACLTLIAIMSEILRRPEKEAGPLIKTLMLFGGEKLAI